MSSLAARLYVWIYFFQCPGSGVQICNECLEIGKELQICMSDPGLSDRICDLGDKETLYVIDNLSIDIISMTELYNYNDQDIVFDGIDDSVFTATNAVECLFTASLKFFTTIRPWII